MNEAAVRVARTDWQSVLLTLLLPLLAATSFVYLALSPDWDDSGEWAVGMLGLIPLEFVRTLVLAILADTFRDYRTPAHAVRFFLLSLALLAAIGLCLSLWNLGVVTTVIALLDPATWRMILPPALVITLDGVIGLYFFRGDPRWAAARLEAQADDAQDLFTLALFGFPLLVVLPCFIVFVRVEDGAQLPDWAPPGAEGIRAACLLYAAVYFAARGLLLAQACGARFQRTGMRALGAPWVRFVLERDRDKRRASVAEEAKKSARRRAALAGEELPADTAARTRAGATGPGAGVS